MGNSQEKDTLGLGTIPQGAIIEPAQSKLLSHVDGLQMNWVPKPETGPDDGEALYVWIENSGGERVYLFCSHDLELKQGEIDEEEKA